LHSRIAKLVVNSPGKQRELEIGQELTIGRGYSNLLRLEGEEISRVHAIIYQRNGAFHIRDLDSKNGIYVNTERVSTAELDRGDRIQIGKYKLTFDPVATGESNESSTPASNDVYRPLLEDDAPPAEEATPSVSLKSILFRAGTPKSTPVMPDRAGKEETLLLPVEELYREAAAPQTAYAEALAPLHDKFFSYLLEQQPEQISCLHAVLRALHLAVRAHRTVLVQRVAVELELKAIVAEQTDVAINRIVLKAAFLDHKAVLCPRTDESGLFRENDTVRRDRITSLISVPLGTPNPSALLYFDRQGEPDEFEFHHLLLAARVGRLLELNLLQSPYNSSPLEGASSASNH